MNNILKNEKRSKINYELRYTKVTTIHTNSHSLWRGNLEIHEKNIEKLYQNQKALKRKIQEVCLRDGKTNRSIREIIKVMEVDFTVKKQISVSK